jgi:hypothetical protein
MRWSRLSDGQMSFDRIRDRLMSKAGAASKPAYDDDKLN